MNDNSIKFRWKVGNSSTFFSCIWKVMGKFWVHSWFPYFNVGSLLLSFVSCGKTLCVLNVWYDKPMYYLIVEEFQKIKIYILSEWFPLSKVFTHIWWALH